MKTLKFNYYLVYTYILRIFKIKVRDFLSMSKSSLTVIYRHKIFTKHFTQNKQKNVFVNNLLFYAIIYHFIALQVDIITPSWIPPGILKLKVMLAALEIIHINMDKKFIMTIMNFKWLYIWVPLTKFRTDEIYLNPITGNVWRFLKTGGGGGRFGPPSYLACFSREGAKNFTQHTQVF